MTDPVTAPIKRPHIILRTRRAHKLPRRRCTRMQIRRRLLRYLLLLGILLLLLLGRILVGSDAWWGLVGRSAGRWARRAGGLLVGGAVGEVWRRRVLVLWLLAGSGRGGICLCGRRGGAGGRWWVVLVRPGWRGGGGWGRGELLLLRRRGILLLLGWGAGWRSFCERWSVMEGT